MGGWLAAKDDRRPAPTVEQETLRADRIFLSGPQSEESATRGFLPTGTRSVLNLKRRLAHGEFVWTDHGVKPGSVEVRVDLRTQIVSVFRGGHEIGTAVILYGAENYETPLGRFPILAKLRNHRSSTYDAPMPFTLRLTDDGVSIHGSEVREGASTHGCVGVPSEFAEHLFDAINVGASVTIVRTVDPRSIADVT